LVAVSTTAQPRDDVQRPVSELLWPNFVEGHLSINQQPFVEDNIQDQRDQRDQQTHAWRIGEKLGLTDLVSLAPLFAFWSLVGVVTWSRRAT
jgi:hypothetical protein